MDENEAGAGGFGEDPIDQFHGNEAISAVVDEGFLGEEDDDYEDLYNDVNVGENFMQSLRKNEDKLGNRSEQQAPERKDDLAPAPIPPPVGDSGGVTSQNEVGLSNNSGRAEGYQNVGFGGNTTAENVTVGRETVAQGSGGGLRVELGQSSSKVAELEERIVGNNIPNSQQMVRHPQPHGPNMGNLDNVGIAGNVNGSGANAFGSEGIGGGVGGGGGGGGGGGTILFVGDLHWWTTDVDLEMELCKYGAVKEVKFFEERASGKSKGYCQVEFYDPTAATLCKEGMNGFLFNGRPCVVAYASPFTVKRMGEAQVNRNQPAGQAAGNQPRRGPGDFANKPAGGNIVQNPQGGGGGGDNNGRGFGRGNWVNRGGNSQGGMGNRAPMGGPMRNRAGGMGGRGMMGNGNGFGPGMGATPPMMHPQAMMGQGFDPSFGGPMGRMGAYGGFPGAPGAHFSGMFGHVGNVGLPGVAPHVNPAFFGRGMPMNGMGMMPNAGVEGPNMGMWSDPNMGGWGGEEHGGRAGESSYGEEAASEHQYGEGSQERGGPWQNPTKEKDKGSERDWSESSERRYRDDRGAGYEKDVSKEKDRDHDWSERRPRGDDRDVGRERDRDREKNRERERSMDHERERERHRGDHQRYRNREPEYDDEWDRGRSSKTHSKTRVTHEEKARSRSRDADYGKRRRLTSD